jgi:hypothetical protein
MHHALHADYPAGLHTTKADAPTAIARLTIMDAGVIFMKSKGKLSPQVIIAGENQASLA